MFFIIYFGSVVKGFFFRNFYFNVVIIDYEFVMGEEVFLDCFEGFEFGWLCVLIDVGVCIFMGF